MATRSCSRTASSASDTASVTTPSSWPVSTRVGALSPAPGGGSARKSKARPLVGASTRFARGSRSFSRL